MALQFAFDKPIVNRSTTSILTNKGEKRGTSPRYQDAGLWEKESRKYRALLSVGATFLEDGVAATWARPGLAVWPHVLQRGRKCAG